MTYARRKGSCTKVKRRWHRVMLGAQRANGYYSWKQTFRHLPKGAYVIAARITSGTYHHTVIGAPLQLVIH